MNKNYFENSKFIFDVKNYFHSNFNKNYLYTVDDSNYNEFKVFDNITSKIDESYFNNLSKRFNHNYKFFLIISLIIFIISSYISIEFGLITFILLFLLFYSIIKLPEFKKKSLYSNISREIPFALRQMSIELKAGKGLNDVLLSISKSDYGILSLEFSRVINEVKYGMLIEDSLINMSKRVNSESLNRLVYQIITSKKIGSNLSKVLSIIAEDTAFNMRIKLKNYSQKLNAFIMIYTFLVILVPVVFLIMIIGASTVIGEILAPDALIILYVFFFPIIIVFMGFFIKKLEPKI
ncbi:hypothetical protein BGI41_08125 [Methanobrevibacter sp. 87.7]|nr:hypothetical protein BGI41_08125 [Methanobrevibacter sp. 87.7]